MLFELTILGCGSALPANGLHPTAQVLDVHGHLFLIDCGEGTQIRLSDFGIKRSKIDHCFISHFHGDHIFGLPGLITSYALMGRSAPLHLYSPPGLERLLRPLLWPEGEGAPFTLIFHEHTDDAPMLVFDNEVVEVTSLPLQHRRPTTGYLFKEKKRPQNLRPEALERYDVPVALMKGIKNGGGFTLPNGTFVENSELAQPAPKPRSYAFCSDTVYCEALVPLLKGVDLLYHEASFANSDAEQAAPRGHSTAEQAATIAHKAEVGQLLLGHFSGRYKDLSVLHEEAKAVFSNTLLAEEGKSYCLESH
jgi:ribonuclease Z